MRNALVQVFSQLGSTLFLAQTHAAGGGTFVGVEPVDSRQDAGQLLLAAGGGNRPAGVAGGTGRSQIDRGGSFDTMLGINGGSQRHHVHQQAVFRQGHSIAHLLHQTEPDARRAAVCQGSVGQVEQILGTAGEVGIDVALRVPFLHLDQVIIEVVLRNTVAHGAVFLQVIGAADAEAADQLARGKVAGRRQDEAGIVR